VNRSRWVFLALVVVFGGGLIAAFLGPRGPEEFPLAELVPADAVFYAGFPDVHRLEEFAAKFPGAVKEEDRKRFEEAKPHLSGAVAFYVDSKGEWVGLARLTRAAALVAGAQVEGDAAVFAQTPAALERRRARTGALIDVPEFQRLNSHLFLNLDALGVGGRLADFTAAGFRLEGGDPLTLRGRALYRPDRYRLYLERYVQAPREAGTAPGGPPLQLAMTDPFLRLWDEILDGLDASDRDRVERECQLLRRDVTEGHDVREVLGRLGPRWGIALSPGPALVAWVELPDAATGEMLGRMIERAAQDAKGQARGRGQAPPFELEKGSSSWRLKLPKIPSLRLGDSFSPVLAITKDRLIVATRASALEAPGVVASDAHAELSIRVAPAIELARSMVPFLADLAFRSEADGMAWARHLREYGPIDRASLSRKIPDPMEREQFLQAKRAEFTADALAELSRTDRYKGEVERLEKSIASGSERLSGIDRLSWTGRFTGEGLQFELRGWVKSPRAK
jgi:hypothetical protein